MIRHELLRENGVLIVRPEGALSSTDFDELARVVDPYLEEQGKLDGLMIVARCFPGWEDLAGLVSHLKFVKDHHRKIRKVAAVTDDRLVSVMPRFVNHFVSAEVRRFGPDEEPQALSWLED